MAVIFRGAFTLETATMRIIRQSILAFSILALALIGGESKKPEPIKETTVYVTKTGAKYHADGCRYLSKSQISIALSEAKKRFSACSVCKPPSE